MFSTNFGALLWRVTVQMSISSVSVLVWSVTVNRFEVLKKQIFSVYTCRFLSFSSLTSTHSHKSKIPKHRFCRRLVSPIEKLIAPIHGARRVLRNTPIAELESVLD